MPAQVQERTMRTLRERKLGHLFVKVLVGAGLLIALCTLVDAAKTAALLNEVHLLPLATAFAVSGLGVLISAEKWRGLLWRVGIMLSFAASVRLYWIGTFCSNFLPTSIGGDAVRLVLTPAPGCRALVAGSILVERLTGFLVMLALCTIGLILRPEYFDEPGLRGTFLAAVLALEFGVIVILLAPDLFLTPFSWLAERLPALLGRAAAAAARVAQAAMTQALDPAGQGRAIGLSVCFYGTIILVQHAVLRAAGAEVQLIEVALVAAVVPLLSMLPVSLNGLGVAEGVFVLLYIQLGVDPETALAAAVLRRVVDLAHSGLGGLFWLVQRSGVVEQDEAFRQPSIAAG
jgi:glycosyltransferase 2 family protein